MEMATAVATLSPPATRDTTTPPIEPRSCATVGAPHPVTTTGTTTTAVGPPRASDGEAERLHLRDDPVNR